MHSWEKPKTTVGTEDMKSRAWYAYESDASNGGLTNALRLAKDFDSHAEEIAHRSTESANAKTKNHIKSIVQFDHCMRFMEDWALMYIPRGSEKGTAADVVMSMQNCKLMTGPMSDQTLLLFYNVLTGPKDKAYLPEGDLGGHKGVR